MEILGTKEAFKAMISQRGVYKHIGVDRSTVSNWKNPATPPSLEKMEEMLLKYGATVIQEKKWKI